MAIRITQDILFANSLLYIQQGMRQLEEAQVPLLTGKRINRPSDDPFGTVQVLKFREERRGIADHLSNIQNLEGIMASSDSALQSLSNLLIDVRATTIEGATETLNQIDRDTLADQIEHAIEEALSLANSKFGGRYLFGGNLTTDSPFTYHNGNTVTYSGDAGVNYAKISSGAKIAVNIPGSEIFMKMDRGSTVFQGDTGAASGTGTDSGTGNATLQVIHGTTTYAGGSGVAAGTGSAAGDTIIGPAGAHTLTLNINTPATTGTISLDGGTPVSFDTAAIPDPANFLVANDAGDQVYLDLTGLTAGFSGTVDITSTGSLTLDGGATTTAIDFSSNQVLHNSLDGTVTNVDSSNIVRTGQEYVTYEGTFDLFQVLMGIRDDLKNTRGLNDDDQIDAIAGWLAELDRVHNNALAALGEFGGRSQRLQMTNNRLSDFDVALAGMVSKVEEADITKAIMELEMAQQGLQIAQAVATQLLQTTLLGGNG